MRVHSIPADKGYTFSCSRRAIDACLGGDRIEWISFGSISRHFEFDSNTEKRPRLSGTVVAALTYCPDGHGYICLYPIRQESYLEVGKSSFADVVLPRLREWLNAQYEQGEMASSRYKQIIAEWTKGEHVFHILRFLYATH